ncbi:hypothetical protein EDB89DRAFT_2074721 [Lactarius sanguifluus]|nr:hypothetical protein EDB89DRAFT_2074721 [Lactarius sanguifluus]
MLTLEPAPAPAPGAIPIRRASHPSSTSTSPPTIHQRSRSQQSRPRLYTHAPAIPMTGPPGVDGLSTTHMQAPLHASTLPQTYHEHLQWHQQQQHLQQLVHGFDPHAQHVISHAQIAPTPPLPSSHPKPRLLVPAQFQTNPQQTQQQNMTHTPTTASMLIPATVPVHSSSSTEQTLVQIRAQPPAPAPTAGPPFPLAMQMVSTTRMREQVQTHTQQAAAVAGASVDATTSANAGAGAGSIAVQSTPGPGPGTQTRGPAAHIANATPSYPFSRQQQHHQRFAVPPALAAFKQEFAAVHAELGRSAREKQALTELLQRLQGERMQAMHALHSTQTELQQCMGNFQSERRTRVHLERRLAEMTQLIEKCTCGATSAKISPSTVTPPPLVVLDHAPACSAIVCTFAGTIFPSFSASPRSSRRGPRYYTNTNANARVWFVAEDNDPVVVLPLPRLGQARAPRSAVGSNVRPRRPPLHLRRRLRLLPPIHEKRPAPVYMAPTTQVPREQPSPKTAPPQQQEQQDPETPKIPVVAPRRKIGIQHIQLVYETAGSMLQCRMLRKREVDSTTHVATFPLSAAYPDLVGHCEQEHDAALDALACMSPGEIAEMRQRFQAAQSPQ